MSINIATKATLGSYLVDANGMTLYYFTQDSVGKSTATAAILANWPISNATILSVNPALNQADFGTITRDDGQKQNTYKDWPLYYYINDKISGDTNGQGIGGVWFVINYMNFPPTLSPSSAASPTPTVTP